MIRQVKLERVNVKDKRVSKNQKEYYPVGIAVKGKWYNQNIFDTDQLEKLKEGETLLLDFYQEAGTGDYAGKMFSKFKFPSGLDLVKMDIQLINKRLDKLEGNE